MCDLQQAIIHLHARGMHMSDIRAVVDCYETPLFVLSQLEAEEYVRDGDDE